MNATEQIDELIANLPDWRGTTLANLRRIIHEADPAIVEEWKWRVVPVFSDHGIVCVANAFKDKVRITFYEGASLPDPDKLFDNGLDGANGARLTCMRATKQTSALKVLVRAAVDFNKTKRKPAARKKATKRVSSCSSLCLFIWPVTQRHPLYAVDERAVWRT